MHVSVIKRLTVTDSQGRWAKLFALGKLFWHSLIIVVSQGPTLRVEHSARAGSDLLKCSQGQTQAHLP